MLTVTELARIASHYATRMADAMIAACVRHALETGEKFDIPEKTVMPRRRGRRPKDEPTEREWRDLVERNSDTRGHHV